MTRKMLGGVLLTSPVLASLVGEAIQADMKGIGGQGKEWSYASRRSNALYLLQNWQLISSKPS